MRFNRFPATFSRKGRVTAHYPDFPRFGQIKQAGEGKDLCSPGRYRRNPSRPYPFSRLNQSNQLMKTKKFFHHTYSFNIFWEISSLSCSIAETMAASYVLPYQVLQTRL